MIRFARLFTELDAHTATNAKVSALTAYFADAKAADAAWAVYFLAGGKPRQTVPKRLLREIASRAAGLPDCLFEESYQAVGDTGRARKPGLYQRPAPSRSIQKSWRA